MIEHRVKSIRKKKTAGNDMKEPHYTEYEKAGE